MHIIKSKEHDSKVFYTYNNDTRIHKSISTHPFNRSLTILHSSSPSKSTPSPPEFFTADVQLLSLLTDPLLSTIQKGHLTALSRHADAIDAITISGSLLTLSLTKERYQRAGLEGHKSRMQQGKWLIRIDFSEPGFRTSKTFGRLVKSFTTAFPEPMELLISVSPELTDTESLVTNWTRVSQRIETSDEERQVPDFSTLLHDPPDSDMQELIAFTLASLALPNPLDFERLDPYISTVWTPEPNRLERVTGTTITGFMTAEYVSQVINHLESVTDASDTSGAEADKDGRWWSVMVRGFEDAAVSWTGSEHGLLTTGENCITILSMPPSHVAHDSGLSQDVAAGVEGRSRRKKVMWEVVGGRDTHC